MQSSQRLKSEVASFEEIKKLNKRQIVTLFETYLSKSNTNRKRTPQK